MIHTQIRNSIGFITTSEYRKMFYTLYFDERLDSTDNVDSIIIRYMRETYNDNTENTFRNK